MLDNRSREAAEALALQALSFLARDPQRIGGFLASSGLDADQLRLAVQEPGFFAAVLGHLMSDEPMLLMFAEDAGVEPRAIPAAHRMLSGPVYEP